MLLFECRKRIEWLWRKWIFTFYPVIPIDILIFILSGESFWRRRDKRIFCIRHCLPTTRNSNIIAERISIVFIRKYILKSFHKSFLLEWTELYDSKIVVVDLECPEVFLIKVFHSYSRSHWLWFSIFSIFKVFESCYTISIIESWRKNPEFYFITIFKFSIERNRFWSFIVSWEKSWHIKKEKR